MVCWLSKIFTNTDTGSWYVGYLKIFTNTDTSLWYVGYLKSLPTLTQVHGMLVI